MKMITLVNKNCKHIAYKKRNSKWMSLFWLAQYVRYLQYVQPQSGYPDI